MDFSLFFQIEEDRRDRLDVSARWLLLFSRLCLNHLFVKDKSYLFLFILFFYIHLLYIYTPLLPHRSNPKFSEALLDAAEELPSLFPRSSFANTLKPARRGKLIEATRGIYWSLSCVICKKVDYNLLLTIRFSLVSIPVGALIQTQLFV